MKISTKGMNTREQGLKKCKHIGMFDTILIHPFSVANGFDSSFITPSIWKVPITYWDLAASYQKSRESKSLLHSYKTTKASCICLSKSPFPSGCIYLSFKLMNIYRERVRL